MAGPRNRQGRPCGAPSQHTYVEQLNMHVPNGIDNFLAALDMSPDEESRRNFKAWLFQVLEEVPEYTNSRRVEKPETPSHPEMKRLLDSDVDADLRIIEMPLDEMQAEDFPRLTVRFIFARLVRHMTAALETPVEPAEGVRRNHTPTFSPEYRNHGQSAYAKFRLVWNLVLFMNKQFFDPGLFRTQDAQARIENIRQNYTQRANGDVEPINDVEQRIEFYLTSCIDYEVQPIGVNAADFPNSLEAFKDLVFARYGLNAARVGIHAIYFRSRADWPADQRKIDSEPRWQNMMRLQLPVYELSVAHNFSPPHGEAGDPNEPGYIPGIGDKLGSFPAYLDRPRQLDREAQIALINKARELLARRNQQIAEFEVEAGRVRNEDDLVSAREFRRQEIAADIDEKVAGATEVSRNDIDVSRSSLNSKQPYASEADADAYLQQATGLQNLSSIVRLPRRSRRQGGRAVDGLILKPHQKTGLAMLVDKEATIGGSVLADTMGLGKTALFASLMIAGNVSEAERLRVRQEPLAQGINAVVVPSSLAAYITEELYDMMGAQWKVYRLGHHKQLYDNSNRKRTIKIGQHQAPWLQGEADAPPLSQRVLVITYEQLSLLQNDNRNGKLLGNELVTSDSPDRWQNLFRRMIFDEGHHIRRFDETLRGKNARLFSPKFRHVVTGTPILRGARDLRGYVALVERPDWLRSDIDRNEERDANGDMRADSRYNRYRDEVNRCKLADRLPDETQFADDGEAWRPNVRSRTQGCDNDEVARGRLLNTGVVTDWPATMFYNSHRRQRSVPRKERYLRTWPVDTIKDHSSDEFTAAKASHDFERSEECELPFGGVCPFDTYSPYDKNKVRCLTVQAFNVWIEPHLRRWERDQDKNSLSIASQRLRVIYEILFIARNSQTVVNMAGGEESVVGAGLPALRLTRSSVPLTQQEMQWYREFEEALGQEVNVDLGDEGDETGITMADLYPYDYLSADARGGEAPAEVHPEPTSHYRSTIIPMISHLGSFVLRKRSTPQWQEQRKTSLAYFVYELRKCKALDLDEEEEPFTSDVAVLEQALRGAAPLAKALVDIWDTIENAPPDSNKVIGYCTSPRSVELFNKILWWVGISTVVLRSTDDPDYRNKLITEHFNKEVDSHHVLLAPLTLRIAGWNLHYRSHNVIFIEEPPALPIFEQAMYRIRRLGQTFEQCARRYYVPGTYHADMEKTMFNRALQIEMVTNDYLHSRDDQNGRVFSREDMIAQAENYCLNVLGLVDERENRPR